VGTGSGAIVIALASEQSQHRYTATDVSAAAVRVAGENARRHGVEHRIDFICADGFDAIVPGGLPFDIIVSNPPYIRSGDLAHLAPEIYNYEPHLALDGTENGLAFIRRMIEQAPAFLKTGGRLLMEIAYDQDNDVRNLGAAADAYADIAFRRDLNGHIRVVALTKK
jgi:release factor glutamine methyltransferase